MSALRPTRPTSGRLTLGRERRLHGPGVFRQIRTGGERRVCGSFIMNWRRLESGRSSRVGVVTSRQIGGAVIRSRARRILREAFRLQQATLREPVDMVLVARRSLVERPFVRIIADLRRCLREAGLA